MLHGLGTELRFYEGALALMDSVRAGSLPLVYPDITESDCRYSALRDIYLLCEGKIGDEIIPNDLDLSADTDGMIVRGGNGTGKTVFLRSVGTAQLLAQAGLPVCADSARVAIRSGVYTHFSSAEEDFIAGDTAGRFEGEVRAVSAIIDVLTPRLASAAQRDLSDNIICRGCRGNGGHTLDPARTRDKIYIRYPSRGYRRYRRQRTRKADENADNRSPTAAPREKSTCCHDHLTVALICLSIL